MIKSNCPAALLVVVAALLATPRASAQHVHDVRPAEADSAAIAFILQAREATQRYHRLDAAIAAGYRLAGPDMPNMGEHWVNLLLIRGTLDPAVPAILTYLRVKGEPVLTGVAYTAMVRDGESSPTFPVPHAAWHYHAGTLEEEVMGQGAHGGQGGGSGVRLAMVHAWIWTQNPDGVFAADNWALSFVRLGLPVPEVVPPAAAKALFLLEGGVDYYAWLVESAGEPSNHERAVIHRALDAYRERVQMTLQNAEDEEVPLQDFVTLWKSLWKEIRRSIGKDLWHQIRVFAGYAPSLQSSGRCDSLTPTPAGN